VTTQQNKRERSWSVGLEPTLHPLFFLQCKESLSTILLCQQQSHELGASSEQVVVLHAVHSLIIITIGLLYKKHPLSSLLTPGNKNWWSPSPLWPHVSWKDRCGTLSEGLLMETLSALIRR
jgi:hypothetical protein